MSIWRGWEVLQVWSPSKRRVDYERMRVDLENWEAVKNTCWRYKALCADQGQLLNCLVISLLLLKHVDFHQKIRWSCVIDFMFLRNTRTLHVWNAFSVFKNLLGITLILIITSLDCKEIQPVHSEGDQPWDFSGRNDADVETPVLWAPHAKSWLIGKDPDAGRDSGQEDKGMTEDEMAGWHHWLDGHESEWTQGVGDGRGGLAYCDSWGRKESVFTTVPPGKPLGSCNLG